MPRTERRRVTIAPASCRRAALGPLLQIAPILLLGVLSTACVETLDLRSDGASTPDEQDAFGALPDVSSPDTGLETPDAGEQSLDAGFEEPDAGFTEDAEPGPEDAQPDHPDAEPGPADGEPAHPDAEPQPEDAGFISDCEAEGADCVEPIELSCPPTTLPLELSCLTPVGGEGLICCIRQ